MSDTEYMELNEQLVQLLGQLEWAIIADNPSHVHIRHLARLTYNAAVSLGYELIAQNALSTLDSYNGTN